MSNRTFTLFQDDLEELIEILDDRELGALTRALVKYNMDGTEPSKENKDLLKTFIFLKGQMDRYHDVQQKRSEAGRRGGMQNRHGTKNEQEGHAIKGEEEVAAEEETSVKENSEQLSKEFQAEKNLLNQSEAPIPSLPIPSNPILSNPLPSEGERSRARTRKLGFYQNVIVSEDELAALRKDIPETSLNKLVEELSGYIKSSGKTYSDHAATLRLWFGREKEKQAARTHDAFSFGRNRNRTLCNYTTDTPPVDLDELFRTAGPQTFKRLEA